MVPVIARDRAVSSRSPMGKAVLDFFKHNTDYNLIFAPHVILYQRRGRHGARLLHGYRKAPNIHIDTGSLASIDITYTDAADIDLGDVSSQDYEFPLKSRPCILLNAHNVAGWGVIRTVGSGMRASWSMTSPRSPVRWRGRMISTYGMPGYRSGCSLTHLTWARRRHRRVFRPGATRFQ
jgi:hypothetical protein